MEENFRNPRLGTSLVSTRDSNRKKVKFSPTISVITSLVYLNNSITLL